MKHNIFSDLRKPGLVPGESLSLSKKYEFCFRETLIYNISLITFEPNNSTWCQK